MENLNHHSITLIDSLADITQHHDRQMLEESVMRTIGDLFPVETIHLFRLHVLNKDKYLSLVASIDQNKIVSVEDDLEINTLSEKLRDAVWLSAKTNKIEILINDGQQAFDIIYPISNSEKNVSSLLVCRCSAALSGTEQQIISGILNVYSNYLSLIDKTQHDKLTGLFNRETLDAEITKILLKGPIASSPVGKKSEKRQSNELSTWLGVVDIDHFKAINDTYGHLYGDEVLILVARLMMRSCVREDDLVYRYGGEEFVVMLKAANENKAMVAFDRLRQNVYKHEFPQVGNVAISIGFVEVLGQQSPADVIGMADEALYYAKENGRNQSVSYQALLEQGKIIIAKQVDNSDVDLFIDKVIF